MTGRPQVRTGAGGGGYSADPRLRSVAMGWFSRFGRRLLFALVWTMPGVGVAAPDRIDYERLADAPVRSVRFMHLRDWEALDDRTIVLWVGRQEPYLVKLDNTCVGLTFNNTIGVTSFGQRLFAGFDRVLTADGNCRIVSIQPLDYAALQSARIEMRAGRDVLVRDRTAPEPPLRDSAAPAAITVSAGQRRAGDGRGDSRGEGRAAESGGEGRGAVGRGERR